MPKLADDEQFWMVVRKSPTVHSAPRVRHATYGIARSEAQRLADKYGEPFVVLYSASEAVPAAALEEAPA